MLIMSKILLLYFFLMSLKNSIAEFNASGLLLKNLNGINFGDKLECEALDKSKSDTFNNNLEYYTIGVDYSYIKAKSKNCFSFKIRGVSHVCIAMSSTPKHSPEMLEIVLNLGASTIIRKRATIGTHFVTKVIPNLLNDQEFRGFWVHYSESGYLEMGRENETTPFISYQHTSLTVVNFIGITTWTTYGSWIIDSEPKCPGIIVKSEAEIMELQCAKPTKFFNSSFENFNNIQGRILFEINKITKRLNVTSSTNSLAIEDLFQNINKLYKKSKSIHDQVIFMTTESDDNAYFIKEDSFFDQIQNKTYAFFEQKSLYDKTISSKSLVSY